MADRGGKKITTVGWVDPHNSGYERVHRDPPRDDGVSDTGRDEEKTEGHSVLRDFLHGTEKHIYLLKRVVKIGGRPHISVGQPV